MHPQTPIRTPDCPPLRGDQSAQSAGTPLARLALPTTVAARYTQIGSDLAVADPAVEDSAVRRGRSFSSSGAIAFAPVSPPRDRRRCASFSRIAGANASRNRTSSTSVRPPCTHVSIGLFGGSGGGRWDELSTWKIVRQSSWGTCEMYPLTTDDKAGLALLGKSILIFVGAVQERVIAGRVTHHIGGREDGHIFLDSHSAIHSTRV